MEKSYVVKKDENIVVPNALFFNLVNKVPYYALKCAIYAIKAFNITQDEVIKINVNDFAGVMGLSGSSHPNSYKTHLIKGLKNIEFSVVDGGEKTKIKMFSEVNTIEGRHEIQLKLTENLITKLFNANPTRKIKYIEVTPEELFCVNNFYTLTLFLWVKNTITEKSNNNENVVDIRVSTSVLEKVLKLPKNYSISSGASSIFAYLKKINTDSFLKISNIKKEKKEGHNFVVFRVEDNTVNVKCYDGCGIDKANTLPPEPMPTKIVKSEDKTLFDGISNNCDSVEDFVLGSYNETIGLYEDRIIVNIAIQLAMNLKVNPNSMFISKSMYGGDKYDVVKLLEIKCRYDGYVGVLFTGIQTLNEGIMLSVNNVFLEMFKCMGIKLLGKEK